MSAEPPEGRPAELVASSPVAQAQVTTDVVVAVNPAWGQLTGATESAWVGRPLEAAFGPGEVAEVRAALTTPDAPRTGLAVAGLRADGSPWLGELHLGAADPSGGAVSAALLPVFPAGPPVQGEREWRALDLDKVLSHDVRGGLRGVTSFLSLVDRQLAGVDLGDSGGQALEFLATARAAAIRTDAMTEQLVHLLRVGLRPAPLVPVGVAGALAAATEASDAHFPGPAAQVVVGSGPAGSAGAVTVWADPGLLVECLSELLTNARKFADGPVRVLVEATSPAPGWVELTLTDDGPGVAPDLAEDAFAPFRLLQPKGRYPGVGLGLPRCRRITRCFGGRIHLAAREGPGATVVLRLAGS